MTIKELIEHLQTLDPELHVFKPGYEGGLEDISINSSVILVELDHNKAWYYGPHEQVLSPEIFPNAVKGVKL